MRSGPYKICQVSLEILGPPLATGDQRCTGLGDPQSARSGVRRRVSSAGQHLRRDGLTSPGHTGSKQVPPIRLCGPRRRRGAVCGSQGNPGSQHACSDVRINRMRFSAYREARKKTTTSPRSALVIRPLPRPSPGTLPRWNPRNGQPIHRSLRRPDARSGHEVELDPPGTLDGTHSEHCSGLYGPQIRPNTSVSGKESQYTAADQWRVSGYRRATLHQILLSEAT